MILGVDKVLKLIRSINLVEGLDKNNINAGKKDFEIEMGGRIDNMIFHEVIGKSNLYKGQWRGG